MVYGALGTGALMPGVYPRFGGLSIAKNATRAHCER